MSQRLRGMVTAGALAVARNWHLALLVYVIVFLITPFDPSYPGEGLDPSWRTGVNAAVAQHLAFGRDIVFTFGPYAAVRTGEYHPQLPWLGVGGGMLLAVGYAVSALVLLQGRRRWVAIVLAVALLAGLATADAVDLLYPMVVALAVERFTSPEADRPGRGLHMARLAVMAMPLGLLPLMKLSSVPALAAGMVAATLLLVVRRRPWEAVAFCLVPAVVAVLLWLLAGQPLDTMVDYATSSLPILTGYTEAMSLDGNGAIVVLFVMATVLFLLVLLAGSRLPLPERLLVTMAVGATLFVTFKASFVRHDGHALSVVFPLIVTALAVASYCRARMLRVLVVLVGLIVALPVQLSYVVADRSTPAATVRHLLEGPVALVQRLVEPEIFDRRYSSSLTNIRQEDLVPRLAPGTDADIYPFDLASLLAQDVDWNPRPVIHSYGAYTPALAKLNADHVRGETGPDVILFTIAEIDSRLPALEDGASWVPLLEHYRLAAFDEDRDYLRLHRRDRPLPLERSADPVRLRATLGRRVALPRSTGSDIAQGWLATFDVRPTLRGRLRGVLYKSAPIWITITLEDGRRTRHRFVPEMGRSQFLLSPLVTRVSTMAGLFGSEHAVAGAETPDPVRAIRLVAKKPDAMWQVNYSVELTAVRLPVSADRR